MSSFIVGARERALTTLIDAQDPGITPNADGLPGLPALRQMVGALVTFGLVICVAGMVVSAAAWAIGSHNNNAHYAGKGKVGCLVSAGAAIVIGSANALIKFFSGISIA
ncbi:hypothetical protein EV643_1397 [Kribbella sp. VKM Ac-2527]|uniref:Uncharacterized protein n=1 Tax=Kribbella caucasensis TaxID=2512215 RepID=A0A4V3C5K2_9ACTN|nr:DUF6112 family protein [Kribbella sp. VKM Ac-2527]TDO30208.1 hypothetical protein EV643_1397 [Kribbella sp. VKM Ac-2527]